MNSNHPTLGNGKICYLEIPAMDVHVSSVFYREVFGWNIRQRSDGHVSFDDGVNEVSGAWVTGRKALAETGLLVYIMVDSVEETVRKILSCGGKIVQPPGADAPEITARFTDPAGNLLGLYQEPDQQ